MNGDSQIAIKPVDPSSPMPTLSESVLEALERVVDLALLIQRQRLFILEFLQGGVKGTTQSNPF
jgi:hypothetical protein